MLNKFLSWYQYKTLNTDADIPIPSTLPIPMYNDTSKTNLYLPIQTLGPITSRCKDFLVFVVKK